MPRKGDSPLTPPRSEHDTFRVLRPLYRHRRIASLLIGLTTVVAAYAAAYVIRFDITWPVAYNRTFLLSVPPLLLAWAVFSHLFHLDAQSWRFASPEDLMEILAAATGATACFWLFTSLVPLHPAVPRSVILMQLVFASYGIGAIRVGYRLTYYWVRGRPRERRAEKRVLVAGAGEAGNLILREMERFPEYGYRLVGFVDDDPGKQMSRLRGVSVLGTTLDIPSLVSRLDVDELVVAIPSATPKELRGIVQRCHGTDVEIRVLPPVEVLGGRVRLNQLRAVTIEDLLAREPIRLELPELARDLAGRSVLITGAAGSIGSELARQIAAYGPSRLVVLDQAESDLYFLELELRRAHPGLDLAPVVADILDEAHLTAVFAAHRPDRVFHAAAYKHVPMMEGNATEAVRNNVIGTWRVASAAGRAGAAAFVLISTDKAADPVNVMGASKHLAEQVTVACSHHFAGTAYTAVRFGNVLGSHGSVVPIFKKQLAEGRSLTVTHPDATRYFMTIPEAVQLVLQASLLPEARGSIAMLDMGAPVKIMDLARNLLRLSGVQRNGREPIEIIGLRPGEKLHEVLVGAGEEAVPTAIEKVHVIRGCDLRPGGDLLGRMEQWQRQLAAGDGDAVVAEMWSRCRTAECSPSVKMGPPLVAAGDGVEVDTAGRDERRKPRVTLNIRR